MAQSLPSTSSVLTPQPPHTPVTQEFSEDLNLRLSLTPDTNGELPGPSSALVRSQLWCLVVKIKFTSLQHFLYPGPAVKQTPILKYDRWCQWSGPGSSSYGRFIRTISCLFLSLFLISSLFVLLPTFLPKKIRRQCFQLLILCLSTSITLFTSQAPPSMPNLHLFIPGKFWFLLTFFYNFPLASFILDVSYWRGKNVDCTLL